MRLAIGDFLGTPIKMRSVAGFTFTEYRYPARVVLRPHSHELAYFSFVLDGSYVERSLTTRAKQCRRSTSLYHPAEEGHGDTFGEHGGWIFSIEIGPAWTCRLQEYELRTEQPLTLNNRAVSALNWRAYRAFSSVDPISDLTLQATATELLCQLPWKRSRKPESNIPPWLRQSVEILHTEYRVPFSLSKIADGLGIHPVHLARTFHRHHGMSMGAYVRQLRVAHVSDALSKTNQRIAEIATEAGFSDQSHLGRTFKSITGMTPQQFKRKSRHR